MRVHRVRVHRVRVHGVRRASRACAWRACAWQVSRLYIRGEVVSLFEALLLLLLHAGSKERTPLLEQVLVFLRSEACLLAQLAQQCCALQHVLRCAAAAATGEAKRVHAGRVVAHQLRRLASRLKQFLSRTAWADVRPVRCHLAPRSLLPPYYPLTAPLLPPYCPFSTSAPPV